MTFKLFDSIHAVFDRDKTNRKRNTEPVFNVQIEVGPSSIVLNQALHKCITATILTRLVGINPILPDMAPSKFSANVQWWDNYNVHILCPFCSKIHRHGFGQSYNRTHRAPHCHPGSEFGSYYFKYPFSENPESTAYEIDKINKRYVALDACPPQAEQDLLAGNLDGLNLNSEPTATLPKWEEAEETIILDDNDTVFRRLRRAFGGDPTFEMKRIDHVISRMIFFGDVGYVRNYLD